MEADLVNLLLIPSVKVAVIFVLMILSVPTMVILERKIIGRMQLRPGPNRVGLYSLLEFVGQAAREKGANQSARRKSAGPFIRLLGFVLGIVEGLLVFAARLIPGIRMKDGDQAAKDKKPGGGITRLTEKWFRNGELQAVIDGLKLLLKEDFIPPKADRLMFIIAPFLAVVPAFMAMTIVPLAPDFQVELFGKVRTITMEVANLPVGILFYFAITSLGIYGIVLAGWSSNSKYSLLGGIRSSAQLISYELTLGMSLIGVLLIVGSFEMKTLVTSQAGGFWNWHVWKQPVGAMLFLIAGFAETNRLPFDLPEGESELGAGFHTEFSSLKFALFFMAEYLNMAAWSAMMTTLFLGGYQGPFAVDTPIWIAVPAGLFWFTLKMAAIFFFFVWVRATLPRLRYDQLMDFGWKALFPLATLNVMTTAAVVAFGFSPVVQGVILLLVGASMIWGVDQVAIRLRRRALGHA